MNIASEAIIQLLHHAAHGSLATHSQEVPGYPFLSILPFVPDEQHCPIFLISGLAEHTRNLAADTRASLLLLEPGQNDVQSGSRLTILGEVLPLEPHSAMIDRYLRYRPSAARLLQLADFRFFRLSPYRLRFIEGFGRMGWLDGHRLRDCPELALSREAELLAHCEAFLPEATQLLGIDRFGVDLTIRGVRHRVHFSTLPVSDGQIPDAVRSAMQTSPAPQLSADSPA